MPDIIIQPRDGKGTDYFENARRSDATLKGILGVILLGASLFAFYYALSTDYWYLGIALLALVIVFFGWSILVNRKPTDSNGPTSK